MWICMVWLLLIFFFLSIDLLNAQPGNASSRLEDCWWVLILKPKDLHTSYIQEAFDEVPECRSTEDHGLVVWLNLPACGVLSSSKYDYGITAISNLLAQYRRNGIALVVHANRASHVSDRTLASVYPCWWHKIISNTAPLLITPFQTSCQETFEEGGQRWRWWRWWWCRRQKGGACRWHWWWVWCSWCKRGRFWSPGFEVQAGEPLAGVRFNA